MYHFFASRNFYLLLLLVACAFFNAIIPYYHVNLYVVNGSLAFTILLALIMITRSRTIKLIVVPLALITIFAYIALHVFEPTVNLFTLHLAANGAFLFTVTIIQIYEVATHEDVTLNTLLGAVAGYLLIGLTWSYFYLAAEHLSPGSFSPAPPTNGSFRLDQDYFTYFSYSSLTTLGYGDIIPRSSLARTLAWMEAAVGQIYLAVWISQLVAIHIAQRIRKNKI